MIQSLADAEKEKNEFERIRDEVECVLLQLQVLTVNSLTYHYIATPQGQDMQAVETGHNPPLGSSGSHRHFTEIESGCHTFPKSRSTKEEMKANTNTRSGLDTGATPVYAQVRKQRARDGFARSSQKLERNGDTEHNC